MAKERLRQQVQREQKFKRELDSFTKSFGRDGSYMEIEMKDIASALGTEPSDAPKMLVLKNNRFDLSEQGDIQSIRKALKLVAALPDAQGMNSEQLSFYACKLIFEKGLAEFAKQS